MEPTDMESIAGRLSTVADLYFPGSIHQHPPPSPSRLKPLLLDLLRRDPSLFLERYGSHLTPDELLPFRSLPHRSYELTFHLSRLEGRGSPSSATVKNRRRAWIAEREREGEYFSEEAMREREPWMHYDMVGRFQDPAGRGMPRPGERWSETLMRRWEEAELVERIRGEQERLGIERKDWVGAKVVEEEEEDEEEMEEIETSSNEEKEEMETEKVEEEEDDPALPKENGDNEPIDGAHGTGTVTVMKPFKPLISEEEMQDQLDQFTHIMQQKFLAGEDTEHLDYSKIDNDERLDDHWLKEANLDAEEKYFDED
ncbi:coiled-coil domain-containing protein 97 [Iris pallida]|uniref:Coiled-coil domain-containing protein 97 n=1 Tax=Iris pallida TaxID=29817 RepID=A0AAX6IFJ3_IRIPA|nr:coiled-coil domain-containing protein 97 [Iris pallida]